MSLGNGPEIGTLHRAGTVVRTVSSTCRGWCCVEVSVTALRVNLKHHSGRVEMAVVQFWAARPSNSRTVSPCTSKLVVWASVL